VEENTFDRFLKVIKQETGIESVTLATPIEALVKDSLEYVSLMMALAEEFGNLREVEIIAAENVAGLLHVIKGAQ
jgi:acyl carrier protein